MTSTGSFSFSKLVIHDGQQLYATVIAPTNLANWGANDLVGILAAENISANDVGFYFTRTNPLDSLPGFPQPDAEGIVDLTLDQRTALTKVVESQKILYIPGSSALLGRVNDLVPFEDLNYVTVVSTGSDHTLHVCVSLLEQRLPRVIK